MPDQLLPDHSLIEEAEARAGSIIALSDGIGERVARSVLAEGTPVVVGDIGKIGLDPAPVDRLVGAGRVDAVRRLAIEPVVRAAQTQSLRADHANVVWRERLAFR